MTRIFLIVIFLMGLSYSAHSDNTKIFSNRRESAVGKITEITRNTIVIIDEQDKRRKSFVYVQAPDGLKIGDRIRIHYYPKGRLVHYVSKMTPVEYEKNTQNAGFLYKKTTHDKK